MTFLEKFENFCKKNNFVKKNGEINIAMFSEKSEIPRTTIDSWYSQGTDNIKLSTLKKLTNFTNTSLDFWGNELIENNIPLVANEFINNEQIIKVYTDPETGLTVQLKPTDKPWEEYTKEEQEQYIQQAMDSLYEYKRKVKKE